MRNSRKKMMSMGFSLVRSVSLLSACFGCQSNQPTAAPEPVDPSWSKVERSGRFAGGNLLRVSSL